MQVSGQLHAPTSLPPGKEPLLPIGQEDGWVHTLNGNLIANNEVMFVSRESIKYTQIALIHFYLSF
jgi:hypothetical protein